MSIQNVLLWPTCNGETPTPLVYGIVNNALLHSSPTINHALPQIVHILHFCLVDSLLYYAPQTLYSTGLMAGLLGDQKSVEMNAGVSCSRRLIVSRVVRWGTVLLKDEELIRDLRYDRQQLL